MAFWEWTCGPTLVTRHLPQSLVLVADAEAALAGPGKGDLREAAVCLF